MAAKDASWSRNSGDSMESALSCLRRSRADIALLLSLAAAEVEESSWIGRGGWCAGFAGMSVCVVESIDSSGSVIVLDVRRDLCGAIVAEAKRPIWLEARRRLLMVLD